MKTVDIQIPYSSRWQFLPFHERNQRFACIVAHRRAGKTVACVNKLIKGAITCPRENPRFAYIAPYYAQAKDAAWTYLKQYGLVFPRAIPNEAELRVDFPNGGRVRLYGADNYDRIRGIYLDGVVLDEYADMDPNVWPAVIRPALSDRLGWADFIGTPKGRNDFCRLYEQAKTNPDWYSVMLKASETNLVAADELAAARKDMTEELYLQEYECSFDAAIVGSYYGKDLTAIDAQIKGRVPYDKAADHYVAWDLGIGDTMVLWWLQPVGKEIHVLDVYANQGYGLDHYVDQIRQRPYGHPAALILPHDAEAREQQTGKTRTEFLEGRDFKCSIVPRGKVDDRINAVRLALSRCWFDHDKTATGVEALRIYHSDYDAKLRTLKPEPAHDWASHYADAFGCGIQGLDLAAPVKDFNRKIEYENLGLY